MARAPNRRRRRHGRDRRRGRGRGRGVDRHRRRSPSPSPGDRRRRGRPCRRHRRDSPLSDSPLSRSPRLSVFVAVVGSRSRPHRRRLVVVVRFLRVGAVAVVIPESSSSPSSEPLEGGGVLLGCAGSGPPDGEVGDGPGPGGPGAVRRPAMGRRGLASHRGRQGHQAVAGRSPALHHPTAGPGLRRPEPRRKLKCWRRRSIRSAPRNRGLPSHDPLPRPRSRWSPTARRLTTRGRSGSRARRHR